MNRFWLKMIACASMLADHICFAFFSGNHAAGMVRLTAGRLAFPIFAFMLTRGFIYTHSRLKYALSMLVTALASEVIYDRLLYGRYFYPGNQNICFLLLLALIMMCLLEKAERKPFLQAVIIAAACAAANYLRLDYSFWGILSITIFYFFRGAPFYISGALACIPLAAGYGIYGAFLSVLPLWRYKESRGRFSTAGKYAFYLFYPAHLAVLLAIKAYIY